MFSMHQWGQHLLRQMKWSPLSNLSVRKIAYQLENGLLWSEKVDKEVLEAA